MSPPDMRGRSMGKSGHAAAHEYVEVVQADGFDAQDDFAGSGRRVGDIFEDELVAPTVFVYDYCAHV